MGVQCSDCWVAPTEFFYRPCSKLLPSSSMILRDLTAFSSVSQDVFVHCHWLQKDADTYVSMQYDVFAMKAECVECVRRCHIVQSNWPWRHEGDRMTLVTRQRVWHGNFVNAKRVVHYTHTVTEQCYFLRSTAAVIYRKFAMVTDRLSAMWLLYRLIVYGTEQSELRK